MGEVAVVVVTYNALPWLERCLESVRSYPTVVVDHDSRRLIWAAAGRDTHTLGRFFDLLGPERSAAITHVSADAADWIADVVAQRCPNAVRSRA